MWTRLIDRMVVVWSEVGPMLGLVLILTLLMTLPRTHRRKALVPLALYLLHFAVGLARVALPPGLPMQRALMLASVFFVWASIGHALFLLVADGLVGRRLSVPIPRIFRDIALVILYFAVALLTLREAGVAPGSLLTTSALLTAVIGLSLQDTLGNVFAGLSIQAQRPFEVGDWVQLSDSSEPLGRVTEINWRATRLLTNDRVEVTIPNGAMARATLRNFSKPTKVLRRQIEIAAPYSFSPEHVMEVMRAAVVHTAGVLATPEPTAVIHLFAESGITYRLRYFLDDIDEVHPIDSSVRERLWYAFRRAGIPVPVPQRDVHLYQMRASDGADANAHRIARRVHDLRRVDLFESLQEDQVQHLASLVHTLRYAPGETILRKGEAGKELFIIEHGEVAVLVEHEGAPPQEVARIGKGQFFGEMSLLTGERRAATVQATQDCALLVVSKDVFQEILQQAPHLAEKISTTLEARQVALSVKAVGPVEVEKGGVATGGVLLHKIREFFSL